MNMDVNNADEAPMRVLLFRTPARCQNGHFCFLFYTCCFGRCDQTKWAPTCDCPTGGFHQGYQKCGPEQQWTGLCDVKGERLFEGDIVEHSKYKDTYEVFWSDAGFSVRSANHVTMLSSLCQQYLTVVGNVCENDVKQRRVGSISEIVIFDPKMIDSMVDGLREPGATVIIYFATPQLKRLVSLGRS